MLRGEINVFNIELDQNPGDSHTYFGMKAVDKIKLIAEVICKIAANFEQQESQAMNIFVLREHGITGNKALSISIAEKNYLKDVMLQIPLIHPSVAIIAGTMLVTKTYDSFNESVQNKIFSAYRQAKAKHPYDVQLYTHYANLIKHQSTKSPVNVVRNSCFMFCGYQQQSFFKRHDKENPYRETAGLNFHPSIFRPGKNESANPIQEFIHPFTHEKFNIAIQICREHDFQEIKESDKRKLYLQIVMSNSIGVDSEKIAAPICIHSDSCFPTRHITKPSAYHANVKLYKVNPFSGDVTLVPPIASIETDRLFWLHEKILSILDPIIEENKLPQDTRLTLYALRNIFQDFMNKNESADACLFIAKFIKKHYSPDTAVIFDQLTAAVDKFINSIEDREDEDSEEDQDNQEYDDAMQVDTPPNAIKFNLGK